MAADLGVGLAAPEGLVADRWAVGPAEEWWWLIKRVTPSWRMRDYVKMH